MVRSYNSSSASYANGESIYPAVVWWLLLLLFLNGFYLRVATKIAGEGLINALITTFEISVIIWFTLGYLLNLVSKQSFGEVRASDWAALGVTSLFVAAPVSGISWIGLTFLALYFLGSRWRDPEIRRLAMVMIALSISVQWSRLLFKAFTDHILRIDTYLIAMFTGTESSGNLIAAADGLTTLQVLEACSSFSNMSLAFLGWVVARAYYGTVGLLRSTVFIFLSCAAVISINTIRIGIIALRPELYDIAHGSIGAGVASLLTTISIFLISNHGARR